jgi:2-phosphoglycerate kinase
MSKDGLMVIKSDGTREPFLRGIMTRTLTQQGVSFDKAYRIAQELKQKLAKRDEVQTHELQRLLEEHLRKRHPNVELSQAPPEPIALPQIWVRRDDIRYPFSKGLLTQSITSAGVSPGRAYLIARQIQYDLVQTEHTDLSSSELLQIVIDQLQQRYGTEVARSYEIASHINDLQRPVIVYLAGAPGTGKSTLATALASRLGILNVVGTDSIREVMRLAFTAEVVPALHVSSFEAGDYLVFHSPERAENRMIAGFNLQSQQVCVGVKAMVHRSIQEGTSLVVEGVHLLPFLTSMPEFAENAFHIPIILQLPNEEQHINRFRMRGKDHQNRAESRYLQHFEDIRAIHNYYAQQSQEHDLDIVDNEELDGAIQQSLQIVISNLQEQMVS